MLGRQTFEDFRGYWPQQTDDQTGITEELNQVQKYVVSSTMTDPQWQNSTVLTGDWIAQVRALKQQEGRDIGVTGSITLTHALIESGLVDEYRLFVYPAVQGPGQKAVPRRIRGAKAAAAGGPRLPERRLLAVLLRLIRSRCQAERRFTSLPSSRGERRRRVEL